MLLFHTKRIFTARFVKYLLVGGFSFLIEFSALYILQELGLSSLGAVAISFWIGLLSAFVLQKIITFRSSHRSARHLAKQFGFYLALVGFNYVVTLVTIALLTPRYDVYILRTLLIAVATVWNYYFYKVLFKDIEH